MPTNHFTFDDVQNLNVTMGGDSLATTSGTGSVAGVTTTRPANATPYTAFDSISNNGTAGSVTATSTNNLASSINSLVSFINVLLVSNDTGPGTGGAVIRLHLFNSDPTASSGVVGGDNAAWSNKQDGWIGSFSGLMRAFSDGSRGVLTPDEPIENRPPATDAQNFWYQLQTLSAFTPSANSTTFTPNFRTR